MPLLPILCTPTPSIIYPYPLHYGPTLYHQVSHALSIPGRKVLQATNFVVGREIGVFKCDIGTVYAAPGMYV